MIRLLPIFAMLLAGCVSEGLYRDALADRDAIKLARDSEKLRADVAESRAAWLQNEMDRWFPNPDNKRLKREP